MGGGGGMEGGGSRYGIHFQGACFICGTAGRERPAEDSEGVQGMLLLRIRLYLAVGRERPEGGFGGGAGHASFTEPCAASGDRDMFGRNV